MNKRWIAALLSVLLVLSLLPGVASAKGHDEKGPAFKVSARAQAKASKQQKTLERMVAQANKRIEQLVKKAQKTPYDDVDRLLRDVNRIVDEVFAYAAAIGAQLECVYVEYYIDGQYVLIDPIRIVRL